jgi:hypothetical protein
VTTFAELETLTVEQTRRPEIPAVTQAAIRTAVLRAHHIDFFPRDLISTIISYTPAASDFYDIPNLSSSILRLRTIKTVQGLETATTRPVEQLEFREADDLYDSEGDRRRHVYTMIGDTLRIYPDAQTGRINVYSYTNPAITTTGVTSWIADLYPDDIAAWAAAIVFARTGFADMAKQVQDEQITPFKKMLLASHLLATVN